MAYRSGSIRHTHTHTQTPPSHTHILTFSDSLSFSLFRHGTFSVYTALTRADYYSVAIKSQFGVGWLSGHLKGHSTRQIVGSIEMDGAPKVEPASAVWKCACKNLGSRNKSEPLSTAEYWCKNECSHMTAVNLEDAPRHLKCIWSCFSVFVRTNYFL